MNFYIDNSDNHPPPAPYFDVTFRNLFIDTNGGESIELEKMDDLIAQISNYERISNTRLFVAKSNVSIGYRQYKCASHLDCPFKATFGQTGSPRKIILKGNYLYHSGLYRHNIYHEGIRFKK